MITIYQDLPITKTDIIALIMQMKIIIKKKKNLGKDSKFSHSSYGNE